MKTKLCNKCGKEFKQRIKIDDKFYSLQRRKFCLDCSPFKLHNTKNLIKIPQFHSRNYSNSTLQEKTEWNKVTHQLAKKRRSDRKIKFVLLLGGKCSICGYNKNYAALHFHHKNPKEKLFSLDSRMMGAKPLIELEKEVSKCQLLCANCHAEHHNPNRNG